MRFFRFCGIAKEPDRDPDATFTRRAWRLPSSGARPARESDVDPGAGADEHQHEGRHEFGDQPGCKRVWHLLSSRQTLSLVQQRIELGPNFIFLGAGDMAIRAFVQRFHLGSWCFRLTVIEIVETPPPQYLRSAWNL